MTKHTPGPWTMKRYEAEHPDTWSGWHIRADAGRSAPPDVAYVDDVDYGPAVAEANARLIAAAPDLLKAVCRLLGSCELNLDEMEEDTFAAIRVAQKAVSMATGYKI